MNRILVLMTLGFLVTMSSCTLRKVKIDDMALKNDIFYFDGNIKPFTGTCLSYFEGSQQLKAVRTYKDGLMNGKVVIYYDNGTISKKGTYNNGHLTGTWQGWYENGKQAYQVVMHDNKMDGEYMAYYENGKIKEKGLYRENKKDGSWNYYNEQGILLQTKSY
jgi:uncharacterized protein